MAKTAVFIMLMFVVVSSTELHVLNVHTCDITERLIMSCPWSGAGIYKPDRTLFGVHTIVFSRFLASGSLDLTLHAPDLINVQVINGDVSCDRIMVLSNVNVYIGKNTNCKRSSTTRSDGMTSESASVGATYSETSTIHSTYPDDQTSSQTLEGNTEKTSIKMSLAATTTSGHPYIQVSWQTFSEIKILMIFIVVIILLTILGTIVWKCIHARSKLKKDTSSDVIFSLDTLTRHKQKDEDNIPTFKFEEFINQTHPKDD